MDRQSSLLQTEYDVESCSTDQKDCLHVKRTSLPMQKGGYVIYGVAHQHSGGAGSTLYGKVILKLQSFFKNCV